MTGSLGITEVEVNRASIVRSLICVVSLVAEDEG